MIDTASKTRSVRLSMKYKLHGSMIADASLRGWRLIS